MNKICCFQKEIECLLTKCKLWHPGLVIQTYDNEGEKINVGFGVTDQTTSINQVNGMFHKS